MNSIGSILQHPLKMFHFKWFGDVVIDPGFEEALTFIRHISSRQRYDKGMLSAIFPFTDSIAGFNAVHHGHVQIHEHHVEFLEFDRVEGFQSIGNDIHIVSLMDQ